MSLEARTSHSGNKQTNMYRYMNNNCIKMETTPTAEGRQMCSIIPVVFQRCLPLLLRNFYVHLVDDNEDVEAHT